MNPVTLFVLQLLGPLFVVVSIKILFEGKDYCEMVNSMRKEKGMSYSLGIIMFVACTALILQHNIWEWNLSGLVTVFAWGGVVKSAILIIKPEVLIRTWGGMKHEGLMVLSGVFVLALGGYFTYVGYFM